MVLLPRKPVIAAALVVFCAGCGRTKAPATGRVAVEERPEHNFRFRPPGPEWSRKDPAQIDPAAALAFTRSRPDLSFLLYVTRSGTDVPGERVVASWKRQLESQASGAVELSSAQLELHGLSGTRDRK